MRFCLVHLDAAPRGGEEEAMVVVPGREKVAVAVPLHALGAFLPLLHEATRDVEACRCPGCGEHLPGPRPADSIRLHGPA